MFGDGLKSVSTADMQTAIENAISALIGKSYKCHISEISFKTMTETTMSLSLSPSDVFDFGDTENP
jgi:hypothetical protein